MTNLKSLSDLFKAAMKLVAACVFATAIAATASAQAPTNVLESTGNAGIGTTTPAYPLTVNQTGNSVNKLVGLANDSSGSSAQSAISFFEGATEKFKFGMNSSGATGYVGGANAFQLWHFQNAPIVFGTNSVERIRIDGGGNVGIGTASPGLYKLYVEGYILSRGTIPALSLYTDATQNSEDGHSIISGTDNVLRIREVTAGVSETRMVIDSSGKVGIGITAPNYKLDVNGEINATGFRINGTPISEGGSQWSGTSPITYTAGNVGIGTTSPGVAIDVVNSVAAGTGTARFKNTNANTQVIIDTIASQNANLRFDKNASPFWYLGNEFSNDRFRFLNSNSNGNVEVFTILQSGKVGIGTTAPDYTLELSGATAPKFALSDTGLANGVTTFAQTDSYFMVDQATDNEGGARVWGFSGTVGSPPLHLLGVFGSADPTDTAAAIQLRGAKRSGTSITTLGNTETVLKIMNQTTDLVTVLGSGNVGIGTIPGALYRLDVQGKINSSELCIATDCKSSWSQVGGGGGPTSFSDITAGTNTVALLVSGSLGVSGSGTINATSLANAANITGGTVPTARLGSGTANNTTFLRGDNTWAALTSSQWTTSGSNINYATAGNVGIGVGTPSSKLDVNGNINVSGTGNITATGTIEAGNIKAKYQDLAEWVPSSEQLSAGTVVVLDTTKSNQVISAGVAYDTRVAGVISAQPGITLGESGEGKVLVATTGRVRVKVDASRGPIQIGDLLVTSDVAGVAMKSEPVEFAGRKMHMPGTIIGKALEPLAKGKGEILVLLSLQ